MKSGEDISRIVDVKWVRKEQAAHANSGILRY